MPDPLPLQLLETGTAFVVFALLVWWHWLPRLAKLPLAAALIPLLWVHAFRFVALGVFAPGQVGEGLPDGTLQRIAWGDYLSMLLAVGSILLLRYRVRGALAAVWLFLVVSTVDLVNAAAEGVIEEGSEVELGFSWQILNVYVPLLWVTTIAMVYLLLTKRSERVAE